MPRQQPCTAHSGSSGIDATAIQMAKAYGAQVAVTVGTDHKAAVWLQLGANLAVKYREQDFAELVRATFGGADVILDIIGASYLPRNVATLREGGRLAIIGQLGGSRGELDLAQLPAKRAMIHAARLRSRPAHEKATIVAATHRLIEPLAAAGQLRPVIDRVLSLDDAAKARCLVESGEHVSKVLLRP